MEDAGARLIGQRNWDQFGRHAVLGGIGADNLLIGRERFECEYTRPREKAKVTDGVITLTCADIKDDGRGPPAEELG
jgi:hypothetical protein